MHLLALVVLAPGYSADLGAPCGVEAKVSIERVGPKGTPAEDTPGSYGITLAVTLTFKRTCWAASRYSLLVAPGPRSSNRLPSAPKKVISG